MWFFGCVGVEDVVEALISNEKLTNPYGLILRLSFYSLIHRLHIFLLK